MKKKRVILKGADCDLDFLAGGLTYGAVMGNYRALSNSAFVNAGSELGHSMASGAISSLVGRMVRNGIDYGEMRDDAGTLLLHGWVAHLSGGFPST